MESTIASIEISDIGCIEKLQIRPDPCLTVIEGRNGVGKSTILNALKSVLDSGHDPDLIRRGAEKGRIKISLTDGITITQDITPAKTTRTVRHPRLGKISKPREWLLSVINSVSFDPAGFLTAKREKRVEMFLQAMPRKLQPEQLTFLPAELVASVNLNDHALDVIGSKTSGLYGALYQERTEINRLAKDKRGTIAEMSRSLPPPSPEGTADWQAAQAQLTEQMMQLQHETESHMRQVSDDAKAADDAVRQVCAETEKALDEELRVAIEKLQIDTEIARKHAQGTRDEKLNEISVNEQEALDEINAKYQPRRSELLVQLGEARARVEECARAEATRALLDRLGFEANQQEEQAETITNQIRQLDELKAGLVAEVPIQGLEIVDGDLMVDGIPFDHINDSLKNRIAVEIMRLNRSDLGLQVLDRAEIFDSEHWQQFKDACRQAGMQLLVARVTDSDLTITPDGSGSQEPEPELITCPACSGSGQSLNDPTSNFTCGVCAGTGKVRPDANS